MAFSITYTFEQVTEGNAVDSEVWGEIHKSVFGTLGTIIVDTN